MFNNQKKNERKLNEISTLIGEGTSVEGIINIESSIRIDGNVYGEIHTAGDVTIGKDGYVEKSVTARNLYIAGKLKGNVKIENKIHIYDSGHFNGIAEMNTIVIDENAHFQGRSIMKGSSNIKPKSKVVDMEKDKNMGSEMSKEKINHKEREEEIYQEKEKVTNE
ncbi:polymer-forming cytoskeletal protein [Evansella sp. AB-P1]|uniref:bactofilin family protein n=1 Tax=Evansella sp. AB-P1 TaxID=3037653 RepID=UPI00241EA43F|nr:polymer-forming cytoskeletal protein [Evansella sp. AB-P1]MDG5787265.1 polymer-forming cytoskeletal protein [Evansella sp. AB-P1]